MPLNQKQREQLLRPINPKRVQIAQGQSHVAGYDVAAHLTRIFGFGNWEKEIKSLALVCEDGIEKNGRTGWNVTYKCEMTLRIKDSAGTVIWSGDDAATGSASNLPSKGDAHDFALKNAVTYALKRCAKDWGDQFGLSLYNKGSMNALVVATLDQAADAATDVQQDLPELHPDDGAGDSAAEPAAAGAAVSEPRPARGGHAAANTQPARAPAQPVKAPAGAETDIDWMGHLVDDLIPSATTRAELTGFWDNVTEHVVAGKCTEEHAKQIQAMVTERAGILGFDRKTGVAA
jgi:hypothetical protein